MDTMRDRFVAVTSELLDERTELAVVLADIGVGRFEDEGTIRRHPGRIVNVGIREQAMIGVAAGIALSGMRPIVHTYAPFLVERPFEQLKLDLSHHDLGAVLVSVGASYDASSSGRTHQAPGDVAALMTLPGWEIHVPGHPDEVETALRRAAAGTGRVYIRLSSESNWSSPGSDAIGNVVVLRRGPAEAPTILAVGPVLDAVLGATTGLDLTVAYTATPHPLDAPSLRAAIQGDEVIAVAPLLKGTLTAEIAAAVDRPLRLRSLGIPNAELRRYGSPAQHAAAHGLDAAGIKRSLADLVPRGTAATGEGYGCSAKYLWMS